MSAGMSSGPAITGHPSATSDTLSVSGIFTAFSLLGGDPPSSFAMIASYRRVGAELGANCRSLGFSWDDPQRSDNGFPPAPVPGRPFVWHLAPAPPASRLRAHR